jgi:hypothetical protein
MTVYDEDEGAAVVAAAIADITSTPAVAGAGVVDVGAAFSQETLNANFAALDATDDALVASVNAALTAYDAKLNAILAALRSANILALD